MLDDNLTRTIDALGCRREGNPKPYQRTGGAVGASRDRGVRVIPRDPNRHSVDGQVNPFRSPSISAEANNPTTYFVFFPMDPEVMTSIIRNTGRVHRFYLHSNLCLISRWVRRDLMVMDDRET